MTQLQKNISISLIALILFVILATYIVPIYRNGGVMYGTVALLANIASGAYLSKVIWEI